MYTPLLLVNVPYRPRDRDGIDSILNIVYTGKVKYVAYVGNCKKERGYAYLYSALAA